LNGTNNVDRIVDFSVADDRISLDDAIFGALSPGALVADAFAANTSGAAQDAGDRVVYETDTGRLYYDSNGNRAAGSVLFATPNASLALTAADFRVV
jgi:serralysin